MDIYPGDLARLLYQEQLLQQEREQRRGELSAAGSPTSSRHPD